MSELLRPRRTRFGLILILGLLAMVPLSRTVWADQQVSDVVSSVDVGINIEPTNADDTNQRFTINLLDCQDLVPDDPTISFTWRFASEPPTDALFTIKVQKNDETCALSSLTTETTDSCLTLEQQASLTTKTLTRQLDFSEIFSDLDHPDDCSVNHGSTYDLALVFTSFSTSTDDTEDDTDLDEVRFQLATHRPSPPQDLTVQAGESSIEVDWASVTEAERYWVYYSNTELLAGADPATVHANYHSTSTPGAVLSDNLVRNTTYWIAVTSEDEFGNESLLSQVVTTTTQEVIDFFEYYRQQGGQETGGYCSALPEAGNGFVGLLLSLLAALALGRRRV
ncbi:MAG: fibronectin type III domain-containing protein [Bradymonadales bacterium]|nr:fibronectin type III domain-containing protein [Bradymonadales bacterium]